MKLIYKTVFATLLCFAFTVGAFAQYKNTEEAKKLNSLQQQFVDLRFGMFIHYNAPTYANADWPDPEAPVKLFNPKKLDANQYLNN